MGENGHGESPNRESRTSIASSALTAIRTVVGGVGVALAVWVFSGALAWSTLVTGAFILFHLGLDLVWRRVLRAASRNDLPPHADEPEMVRKYPEVMITTAAAIIGLASGLQTDPNLASRVGVVSLAISLLLAFLVKALLASAPLDFPAARVVVALATNLTFWAFTYGVISIAFGFAIG